MNSVLDGFMLFNNIVSISEAIYCRIIWKDGQEGAVNKVLVEYFKVW